MYVQIPSNDIRTYVSADSIGDIQTSVSANSVRVVRTYISVNIQFRLQIRNDSNRCWKAQEHLIFSLAHADLVPEMTYYVSSGTLNPTHSLIPIQVRGLHGLERVAQKAFFRFLE